MKQIPYFIEMEASVNNTGISFQPPNRFQWTQMVIPTLMSRLPCSTPKSITSRILTMQDYTTIEMAEVVSLSPLPFMVPQYFNFLISLFLPSQVVASGRNLMRQHALLFKWLEGAKTMRAYIAHNMNDSDELCAKLKSIQSELVAT